MRLIDADALFKDICDSIEEMTKIGIVVDERWLWAKLNDALENAPTVEPERKKGKWFWSDGMYSCGQCHAAFYETSPFCSMCGADMRGEQNESDLCGNAFGKG